MPQRRLDYYAILTCIYAGSFPFVLYFSRNHWQRYGGKGVATAFWSCSKNIHRRNLFCVICFFFLMQLWLFQNVKTLKEIRYRSIYANWMHFRCSLHGIKFQFTEFRLCLVFSSRNIFTTFFITTKSKLILIDFCLFF